MSRAMRLGGDNQEVSDVIILEDRKEVKNMFKKGDNVKLIANCCGVNVPLKSWGKVEGGVYKNWKVNFSGIIQHCCENDLELIEPAAPRRYTGELREDMKVELKRNDGNSLGEGVFDVVEGGSEPFLSNSRGDWSCIRQRQNGEWWATNDTGAYISHVISEPEERKEQPEKEGANEYGCLMCLWQKHLYGTFSVRSMPYPDIGMGLNIHPSCRWAVEPIRISPHKGGIQKLMEGLKSIPAKIKRFLNPHYKAFYQLGWVDEELDLTDEGEEAFTNFLLDKFEADFGAVAQKEVAERKKKAQANEE